MPPVTATETLTVKACTITGTGVQKWSSIQSISTTREFDVRSKIKGFRGGAILIDVPIIFYDDVADRPIVFYDDVADRPIIFYDSLGRLASPTKTLTAKTCTISGTGELV